MFLDKAKLQHNFFNVCRSNHRNPQSNHVLFGLVFPPSTGFSPASSLSSMGLFVLMALRLALCNREGHLHFPLICVTKIWAILTIPLAKPSGQLLPQSYHFFFPGHHWTTSTQALYCKYWPPPLWSWPCHNPLTLTTWIIHKCLALTFKALQRLAFGDLKKFFFIIHHTQKCDNNRNSARCRDGNKWFYTIFQTSLGDLGPPLNCFPPKKKWRLNVCV